MNKIFVFQLVGFFIFILGHNSQAQNAFDITDSLIIQEPLQKWNLSDGKDSLTSPGFIERNGYIDGKYIDGFLILKEPDLLLIAPDRRNNNSLILQLKRD